MKLILRTFIIFSPLFFLGFITGDINSEYKIPQLATSIYSNDMELDNDYDLIVGNHTFWGSSNASITILKNNGSGYFSILDTSESFAGYQDYIFCAKIDNDSFSDIVAQTMNVVSGNTQRFIRVLYNDGNGSFNNYQDFSLNSGNVVSGISTGDINGDQHNDVVMIVNNQQYWGVLYNDGNGGLLPPVYYPVGYPNDIATGDLDNDGRDDVVIATNPVEIFYSYSSGFQMKQLSGGSLTIKVMDMNNDGMKDIVVLNGIFGSNVYIYENTGAQTFSQYQIAGISNFCNQVVVTDLNGDSLPDLLIKPAANIGVFVLYNQGNFVFTSPELITIPDDGWENTRTICSGDFDGNGYNDIAMVRSLGGIGTNYNNLVLLFNDGQGHFLPDPITLIPGNSIPKENSIMNYPNPFHDQTTFDIILKETSMVNLTVYNANGKLIKNLMDHQLKDGKYILSWNGRDMEGLFCLPGIYLACFKLNEKCIKTLKMLIY